MPKVTLNLPSLMGGYFRLTNRRTVNDRLTVDMDADGVVRLAVEIGEGKLVNFALNKKQIRQLIAELAFYLEEPKEDDETE